MALTACGEINHFPSLKEQRLFLVDCCDGTGDDPMDQIKDPYRLGYVDPNEGYVDGNEPDDEASPVWKFLSIAEIETWVKSIQDEVCLALGVSPEDWELDASFIVDCIEAELAIDEVAKVARGMYAVHLRNLQKAHDVSDCGWDLDEDKDKIPATQSSCARAPTSPTGAQRSDRSDRNTTTRTVDRFGVKKAETVFHHSHGLHGKKKVKPREHAGQEVF